MRLFNLNLKKLYFFKENSGYANLYGQNFKVFGSLKSNLHEFSYFIYNNKIIKYFLKF